MLSKTLDPRWFNISAPLWRIKGQPVRLWNLFRRYSTEGHWWGVGLLQVGNRHLLFVGRVQGYPEREVWSLSALFLGASR